MLGTDTLLTLTGGGCPVRLSYVFEDDIGSKKGLTVRRLLPDPSPSSQGDILHVSQRPFVFDAEGQRVGILDPERQATEPSEADELQDRSAISGGALTCVFTIPEPVRISSTFRPTGGRCITDLADCAGAAAHVVGGQMIGTIQEQLNYLQWKERCVYPLLRLERSKRDLADPAPPVRNGAMVSTHDGALVGIIVSIFDKGRFYAVAPIRDVLEWHRLRFMQEDFDELWHSEDAMVREDRDWSLPAKADTRLHVIQGGIDKSESSGDAVAREDGDWSPLAKPDPRLLELVDA